MKQKLFLLSLLCLSIFLPVFQASAAGPVTIDYSPKKTTYQNGDTITLTFQNFPQRGQAILNIGQFSAVASLPTYNLFIGTDVNLNPGLNVLSVKILDDAGNQVPTVPTDGKLTFSYGNTSSPSPAPSGSGQVATSSGSANDTLINFLSTDSLIDFFLLLAKRFMALIGAAAVVAIIIAGFRMILSQGNEEAYGQAKRAITWAIIGVIVAILSFSIIAIVQDLLGSNIDTSALKSTNVKP